VRPSGGSIAGCGGGLTAADAFTDGAGGRGVSGAASGAEAPQATRTIAANAREANRAGREVIGVILWAVPARTNGPIVPVAAGRLRGVASSLGALDVILVRHAEPVPFGSPDFVDDDRPLTEAGRAAAIELAAELDDWEISAIYSSPLARAMETVRILAERRGMAVHVLVDLRERELSLQADDSWRETLARSWADPSFALPGSESGRDAQRRGVGTLDLLRSRYPDGGRLVLGSHGNLISLILQALEPGIGYDFNMAMPTPALYRITHDGLRWRIMGGHGFAPVD
jgi:2,3-bisphosphoglycerate-dependent phosphoglycerate mutase